MVLGPDGRPWHSWRVLVLPYLSHDELFAAYRFDEPWDGPNNRLLADRMPPQYAFHGHNREAGTTANYLAVVGPETLWPGATPRRPAEAADDPAETVLVVENLGAGVHWMEPRDLSFADFDTTLDSPTGVGSPYRRPAVLTRDGAVHMLDRRLPPAALRGLLTAAGGERLTRVEAGLWEPLADGRLRDPAAPR